MAANDALEHRMTAPPPPPRSATAEADELDLRRGIRRCLDSLVSLSAALRRDANDHGRRGDAAVIGCMQQLYQFLGVLDQRDSLSESTQQELSTLRAELEQSRDHLRDTAEQAAIVRHMALHDALTGLPNRLHFAEKLDEALAVCAREGRSFSLLFMDLDGFKAVNDANGHSTGDDLLKTVAARLLHSLRFGDALSRHGGDEFLCLLMDVSNDADIDVVARKIFAAIARPYRLGDVVQTVVPSIGVAVYPRDGEDAQSLIAHADTAMYWAKKHGLEYTHYGSMNF